MIPVPVESGVDGAIVGVNPPKQEGNVPLPVERHGEHLVSRWRLSADEMERLTSGHDITIMLRVPEGVEYPTLTVGVGCVPVVNEPSEPGTTAVQLIAPNPNSPQLFLTLKSEDATLHQLFQEQIQPQLRAFAQSPIEHAAKMTEFTKSLRKDTDDGN